MRAWLFNVSNSPLCLLGAHHESVCWRPTRPCGGFIPGMIAVTLPTDYGHGDTIENTCFAFAVALLFSANLLLGGTLSVLSFVAGR